MGGGRAAALMLRDATVLLWAPFWLVWLEVRDVIDGRKGGAS